MRWLIGTTARVAAALFFLSCGSTPASDDGGALRDGTAVRDGTAPARDSGDPPTDGGALDRWTRHAIDDAANGPVFVLGVDLDGDGAPEIVAGDAWYRNPGVASGAWTKEIVGGGFDQVALADDLDGDGDADLLGTTASTVTWAENDGTGSFTIGAGAPKGGDFPQGVALARFSTGAQRTLAISWHASSTGVQGVTIPDDPSAPWSTSTLHASSQDEALSAADLDGDADIDLFQGTQWLRNDGSSWSVVQASDVGGFPDRNRLADIDGDGDLDAVIGFEGAGTSILWLAFESPASLWPERTIDASVGGGYSLDVADMDADGDPDVVLGEHMGTGVNRVIIYENRSRGAEWAPDVVDVGDPGTIDHHDGAIAFDVDGDTDLDLLSIGWYNDRVWLFENLAR